MTFIEVKTREGIKCVDVSEEATLSYGFRFQDRVSTPKGLGTVMGVNNNNLYFYLNDEQCCSYWSSCQSKADFEAHGFVLIGPETDGINGHRLKHSRILGRSCAIVTQRVNGPCPVLAIANCISLSGEASELVHSSATSISALELCKFLYDHVSKKRPPIPKFTAPSFVNSTSTILGFLQTNPLSEDYFDVKKLNEMYNGIDISPIFSHVDAFEGTPNTCVFAFHGIRLFHTWIILESCTEFVSLRNKSYDAVSTLATEETAEGELARKFLFKTGNQFTPEGVSMLREEMKEREVGVLFRNNHFSTIMKINDSIMILVTDDGFCDKKAIVFERLLESGDTEFLDGEGKEIPRILLEAMNTYGDYYDHDDILKTYDALQKEAVADGANLNLNLNNNNTSIVKELDGDKLDAAAEGGNKENVALSLKSPTLAQVIAVINSKRGNKKSENATHVSPERKEVSSSQQAPGTSSPSQGEQNNRDFLDETNTNQQILLAQLLSMGFSQEDCEDAVTKNPGTVDDAVRIILESRNKKG